MNEIVELVLKVLELSGTSATMLVWRSRHTCTYIPCYLARYGMERCLITGTLHPGEMNSISVANMSRTSFYV